jgi:hypothetical protein
MEGTERKGNAEKKIQTNIRRTSGGEKVKQWSRQKKINEI